MQILNHIHVCVEEECDEHVDDDPVEEIAVVVELLIFHLKKFIDDVSEYYA
jgi:hypothetical protein